MENISLADISALMDKDSHSGLGDGVVGWIILLFIFLLAISGNGFLGGKTSSDVVTSSQLYSSLGTQDMKNDVRNGFTNATNQNFAIQEDIASSKYENLAQFKDLTYQMAECCCNTQKTIMAEAQATRDLMQNQYIDGLRTSLSDAKNVISNKMQNEYLLETLGKWYSNQPYCGCYNTCN